MFSRKRSRSPKHAIVGLDLDPGHIAAAEVSVDGGLAVTRGAVAPLRPGVLRDGEVADPAALTEALKAFWAEHSLPTRVRLGVANQRIVVRTLDLPPLEEPKALGAAVRAEAPDHIPMPMDEAILDFQPLGLVETPAGPRARVIIAAARKEMIGRLVDACRGAGLRLEGIDLSAFAMIRALDHQPAEAEGALLYVNVAGLTNVAVANAAGCLFTRAAAGGLEALATTLAERRSLTLEHARQWLVHVGLTAPLGELEGDPELLAAARGVLEEGIGQLADTVRSSLNFYRMQESAERVEHGIVCGPAVAIDGFAERLGSELKLPLTPVTVRTADSAALAEAEAGRLAVAAGLAVHERP